MSKIMLIRHAISEGNSKGIIQGDEDYALSMEGIIQANNFDVKDLHNYERIITSPSSRTKQTAEIINKNLNLNIEEDSMLKEISAGILDGHLKKEVLKCYPEYYKLYLQRGDYDLIPNAENWQHVNARIIAFLEQYISCQHNDIVISHAAFMRKLMNFLNGYDRNYQYNIPNCSSFEFDDVLKNLDIEKFDIAKSSKVWSVANENYKYILKRKDRIINGDDINENNILKYLNKYISVPEILLMSNRGDYQVKIIKYLNGIHKFGDLDNITIQNITNQVYKMYKLLSEYDEKMTFSKKSISDELCSCLKNLLEDEYKKEALELLNNQKFQNYLKSSILVLVHNDLHRSNILIDNSKINIIDFETLGLYPKELQLATYICSCYLLENPNFNINNILNIWNEDVERDIIIDLIKYRLLYGMSFFDSLIKSGNYEESDLFIRNKYIRAIRMVKK